MRAVFLDRDGVLNKVSIKNGKPYPPKNLNELIILPGVKESLLAFQNANLLTIVVTNQPDVARGTIQVEEVEEINTFLVDNLTIDAFFVCFHDDKDRCDCRKPRPGLLIEAAKKYSIDLRESYMIGDRWRDIEAGNLAGCKTLFIDYSYNEKQPTSPTYRVKNIIEAANIILGEI